MKKLVIVLMVLAILSINALAEENVYETLIGDLLKYTGVATDKEGDMVKITVDWGDDTQSSSEFVPSGTTVNFSHNWERPGIYNLKSQAIDNTGMISEWKNISKIIVSAPTEYLTVWLNDTGNKPINGTVELWNENSHIETPILAGNPFRYQLRPGSYNITGRSPGYNTIRYKFSPNRTLNTPMNITLKLSEVEKMPMSKASGGFSFAIGFIAISFLVIASKRR